MFLRHFILSGFLGAVGNMPDYWIILNAAGYMDKGVLTMSDIEEIQAAIDRHNGTQTSDASGSETGEADNGDTGNTADSGDTGNAADGGDTGNAADGGDTENVTDGGDTENVTDGGDTENAADGSGAPENAGENAPPTGELETGGDGE